MHASWTIDRSKVLTADEIRSVVAELNRKQRRSLNTRMNLVIFRLATSCGLRVSEICGLKISDLRFSMSMAGGY